MTCCILAALIISQILACRDRLKRLLGFKVDADAGLDPLLPAHIGRRVRHATLPLLALTATLSLGYQHRDHLVGLFAPSAHAAAPSIAAAVCNSAAAR
jgi:hypothetical protein